MTDDGTPVGGLKPRAPKDQDVTGTGTPRSADDGLPQPGAYSDADADADVVSGMTSDSQPAFSDEVEPNRSGSGGSGGPVDSDPSVEGSTGQSMNELLAGEEDEREGSAG